MCFWNRQAFIFSFETGFHINFLLFCFFLHQQAFTVTCFCNRQALSLFHFWNTQAFTLNCFCNRQAFTLICFCNGQAFSFPTACFCHPQAFVFESSTGLHNNVFSKQTGIHIHFWNRQALTLFLQWTSLQLYNSSFLPSQAFMFESSTGLHNNVFSKQTGIHIYFWNRQALTLFLQWTNLQLYNSLFLPSTGLHVWVIIEHGGDRLGQQHQGGPTVLPVLAAPQKTLQPQLATPCQRYKQIMVDWLLVWSLLCSSDMLLTEWL